MAGEKSLWSAEGSIIRSDLCGFSANPKSALRSHAFKFIIFSISRYQFVKILAMLAKHRLYVPHLSRTETVKYWYIIVVDDLEYGFRICWLIVAPNLKRKIFSGVLLAIPQDILVFGEHRFIIENFGYLPWNLTRLFLISLIERSTSPPLQTSTVDSRPACRPRDRCEVFTRSRLWSPINQ